MPYTSLQHGDAVFLMLAANYLQKKLQGFEFDFDNELFNLRESLRHRSEHVLNHTCPAALQISWERTQEAMDFVTKKSGLTDGIGYFEAQELYKFIRSLMTIGYNKYIDHTCHALMHYFCMACERNESQQAWLTTVRDTTTEKYKDMSTDYFQQIYANVVGTAGGDMAELQENLTIINAFGVGRTFAQRLASYETMFVTGVTKHSTDSALDLFNMIKGSVGRIVIHHGLVIGAGGAVGAKNIQTPDAYLRCLPQDQTRMYLVADVHQRLISKYENPTDFEKNNPTFFLPELYYKGIIYQVTFDDRAIDIEEAHLISALEDNDF
jgi:hypothetical protein